MGSNQRPFRTRLRAFAPFTVLMLVCAFLLIAELSVAAAPRGATLDRYGDRDMLIYVPSRLPAKGNRALVIVLHGGMGNAQRIESQQSESGLNMDAVGEQNGFIVAYLNGTPVTRFLGPDKLGWNAGGGCCGMSAANNVDDVTYIQRAADYITKKYGIDPSRIYGMGHSNGGMMTQRVVCETGLYAAAVSISGPLNLETVTCEGAHAKRILAIHGADDANVPIAGGRGTKGISGAVYHSEEYAQQVFTNSGASYDLLVVKGADHQLNHIEAAIEQSEGISLPEKATRFFGLNAQIP